MRTPTSTLITSRCLCWTKQTDVLTWVLLKHPNNQVEAVQSSFGIQRHSIVSVSPDNSLINKNDCIRFTFQLPMPFQQIHSEYFCVFPATATRWGLPTGEKTGPHMIRGRPDIFKV